MTQPVTVPESKPAASRRFWTERRRSNATAYFFISPFFILFSIFGIFPIAFTFIISFFKWNGLIDLSEAEFVGFRNYELVWGDPTFWQSFFNTLIIGVMSTVPQLILALIIAVALNSAFTRFKKLFRTLYFLPNITSIVAVTLVFSAIFSNQGMANQFFDFFGMNAPAWTSNYWGVKIAISVMIIWRWTGYNAIIYLAGMQSIPTDLYEAAKIDGASTRQIFWHITLPLLRPFILVTILISTIGSLQLFTEPLVFLGQSGTANTRIEGITMVIYLYQEAFRNYFFGTAAATAVTLFFFTIVFSVINLWITSRGSSGGAAN